MTTGETEKRNHPPVTPEIEQVLNRYMEIQDEHKKLREEKAKLQDVLRDYLADAPGTVWNAKVGDIPVKVAHRSHTTIEYNEELLAERLGNQYESILQPDPTKMKKHIDEITPYLSDVLPLVGSPDSEKVRDAVETGRIDAGLFEGAFEKTTSTRLAVRRVRPRE